MKFFAHLFVGNEFSSIVPLVSEQIIRTGGNDYSSCVNLFVIDDNRVIQHKSTVHSDISIIRGEVSKEELEVCYFDWSDLERSSFAFTESIFNRIMRAANIGGDLSSLYVVVHFPLYKAEALSIATTLYDIVSRCNKPTEFDFVGYCDDMVGIFEPDYTISSPSNNQIRDYESFRSKKRLGTTTHFVAIQNTNQAGITLGLNPLATAKILSTFFIALADNYDKVFPSHVVYKDVVAIGISKLCLDKYVFLDYLLNRSLILSMEQASVDNSAVDINLVCRTAHRLLSEKTDLLSKAHKAIGHNAKDEDFTKYQKSFESEVSSILEACIDEFDRTPDITLRTALLAAILSRTECELFSNTIFNKDSVNYNDLYDEALTYFVENNKGDFYKISGQPIVNPIKQLKNTINKLINSEAQARNLSSQLDLLTQNIDSAEKAQECYVEDGYFHFHDQQFRLLPNVLQEPLSKTYSPHSVTASSIDLRHYFSKVKNQGSQGSCLAHAVTSIFEYVLKRNAQQESDLSEAFLYYNARALDGNGDVSAQDDSGARFKPAMDSLVQFGIALEKYCPYNEGDFSTKPSESAYADAATRKLKVAMNVCPRIEDIKSALVDGFPVAVSFSLYDSFFKANDGYIPIPTEAEIQKGIENMHSHHAMVITGFIDSMRMFVLRNSWGTDWGVQGYCFVPYQYVEDERLCDFCCIITEIDQLNIPKFEQLPTLRIDDSDLQLRTVVTKNALANELNSIEVFKKQRDALRILLESEKKMLSAPNQRDEFISHSEQIISEEIDSLTEAKKSSEKEMNSLSERFDKARKRFIWTAILSILGWTVLFFGLKHFFCKLPIWLYLVVLAVFCCIELIVFAKAWREWREQRDELFYKIEDFKKKIKAKEKEKVDFKINTFTAWAAIKALELGENKLQTMYNNIISLTNNLRTWYVDSQNKLAAIRNSEEGIPPEISLLDFASLDQFFDSEIKGRSEFEIDFCHDLENYSIDQEYLKQYKNTLSESMIDKLSGIQPLAEFNISEKIAEPNKTQIGKIVDRNVLDKANDMSDMFLHIDSLERGIILPTLNVFAPSLTLFQNKLERQFERYSPLLFESFQQFEMVFIKVSSLKFDECVALRSQNAT